MPENKQTLIIPTNIAVTLYGGHDGIMVTNSLRTSEVSGSNPGPYVGKLVVAYRWSVVYSTEP